MSIVLFIILLIAIVEICAQCCLKKYHHTKNAIFVLLGIALYLTVCFLLIKSYRYATFSSINLIWSVASIMLVLVAGVCLFNEPLTKTKLVGVAFIMIGIIVIWKQAN